MEGDTGGPEEEEGCEADGGAHARSSSPQPAVLWEKVIQQSIFVDLSDDESIHLSDLESSFALCLSQQESPASASIHLSEDAEMSDSGDLSSESSDDDAPGRSERVVVGRTKSSVTRASARRPNTAQEEEEEDEHQDPGDTSDEEQEDLPYDGDLLLDSLYLDPTARPEDRSDTTVERSGTLQSSPDAVDVSGLFAVGRDTPGLCPTEISATEMVRVSPEENQGGTGSSTHPARPTVGLPMCSSPVREAAHADIAQLLLRHFSQDELLRSGRLIEAETLPEVSLLESVDDTVLSRAPQCSSTGSPGNISGRAPRRSSSPGGVTDVRQSLWESDGEMSRSASGGLERSSQEEEGCHHGDAASAADNYALKSEGEDAEQSSRGPDLAEGEREEDEGEEEEEEGVIRRASLVRTRSFGELKYGQGQVHYRLPDFSKVAPKVRIPKSTAGGTFGRPRSQSPAAIIHRAQSSPGMLGMSSATRKATAEVISRVLEDAAQPLDTPYFFGAQEKPAGTSPALVHHLQAEYDKLLTKYAEAENLIDQMRLGTKPQAPCETEFDLDCCGPHDHLRPGSNGSHFGSTSVPTAPPLTSQATAEEPSRSGQPDLPLSQTDPQSQSDGEKMTSELRDIIRQFMEKVDEFKMCLQTMSINLEEQQMVFKSMMEAQDQLERKYISRKEEHRALEMQNYLGVARNTGTFDHERLVEGEIFRVGMHLEDIKELIDRNVCEQLSPPPSSSTPSPGAGSSAPGLTTPSPPPAPPTHEGFMLQEPGPCFSIRGYETERREEEEESEAAEVHGDEELTSADSIADSAGQSCSSLQISHASLERLIITTTEEDGDEEDGDEERTSVLSDGTGSDSSLTRHSSPFRDRQWSPDRLTGLTSDELGGSLAVEVSCSSEALRAQSPSDQTPSTGHVSSSSSTQENTLWIVSPESDSGFGSSDLSRPATGLSQPKLHTDRQSVQSQSDVSSGQRSLSGSDSEGSCSNVQTTIQQAEERRAGLKTSVHPVVSQTEEERRASLKSSSQPRSHPQPQLQTHPRPAAQPRLEPTVESPRCSPAVGLWSGSTGQEAPARLLDAETDSLLNSQQQHHHHDCHSITMETPQRDSQSQTCSCNGEAILALQSEVSRLKRDLEEGLVQLPQLNQWIDYLTSRYSQDRRPRTRPRTHHKPASNSVWRTAGSRSERQSGTSPKSSLVKIDDWISSDMDPSKSKGTNSADSDGSVSRLQFHSGPTGGSRGNSNPYTCNGSLGKPHSKRHSSRGSVENSSVRTPDLTHSSPTHTPSPTHSPSLRPSSRLAKQGLSYTNTGYMTQTASVRDMERESLYSKGRFSPLQKPLLQVNYGSSCSLPAGFKVREPPLQSVFGHRGRSTQSDSALLPSNVFFQRTLPLALYPSRAGSRASGRKGSKEEEINRTLDQAIEAAHNMKRTTDRMARSLSADLAKAQLHRKLHGMRPPGSRKHIAL